MKRNNSTNQVPILKYTLQYIQIFGAYSKPRNVLSIITLISMYTMYLFMILDMSMNWTGIESLKLFTFYPSFAISGFKAIFLINKSQKLISIIEELTTFWRPNKFDDTTEKKIEYIFKIITFLCVSYTCTGHLISISILVMPLLEFEQKTLGYSNFALCNLQNLACWIPMYIWQFVLTMVQILPAALTFDLIFIIFTGYIITSFDLLKAGLEKLNTENVDRRRLILIEIVNQHNFLISFIQNMNDLFSSALLLQFTCSLWSMILFLFVMVADGIPPKLGDVAYFGTIYWIIVCQIFIYSFGGAIIETKVQNLSTDMFMVNWYGRGRTDMRKDLSLMIFRAQKTRILNTGKMSDLNLILFIGVMKNSLSVFTLIWQLATTPH